MSKAFDNKIVYSIIFFLKVILNGKNISNGNIYVKELIKQIIKPSIHIASYSFAYFNYKSYESYMSIKVMILAQNCVYYIINAIFMIEMSVYYDFLNVYYYFVDS